MPDYHTIYAQGGDSASLSPTTPNFCQHCMRSHKRFGMEVEFTMFGGDNSYKDIFLRKIHKKKEIDVLHESIGLDGSRRPIELRNINGDTPEELYMNLVEKMLEVRKAYVWMKQNLPAVGGLDTKVCGTHIHFFHPGITRIHVAQSFTAIAMVINDFDFESWNSRLNSGYGRPFEYRPSEWCRSEHATELRTLNAVHPSIIPFVIKNLEEAIKSSSTAFLSFGAMEDFVNKIRSQAGLVLRDRMIYSECINECLAYFIKNKAIKFTQVKRMMRWLRKNYRPLKDFILTKDLSDPSLKTKSKGEKIV